MLYVADVADVCRKADAENASGVIPVQMILFARNSIRRAAREQGKA